MAETLILVVEIETSGYLSDGTPFDETIFMSSHPYYPPEGGSPRVPLTDIEPFFNPVIVGAPIVEFKMGNHVWGYESILNIGSIDFLNTNNSLSYLLSRESKGKKMWFYMGYADQDFVDFTQIAELTQEKFVQATQRIIRQTFADDLQVFKERAIQETLFGALTPNVNLVDTPMPKWYGKTKSCPLVTFDKVNEIYQVADISTITNLSDGVYDSGIELTLGAGASQYQVTTTSDGNAAIVLGSNSSGKITGDGRAGPSGTGINPEIVLKQIVEDNYSITLDSTTITEFSDRNNYNIGVWIDEVVTGYEVLTDMLKQFNAWIYQDPDGAIHITDLREPVGNPVLYIDKNSALENFVKISDDAPNLTNRIGYQKNWFVFDDTELAAAVPDGMKTKLTQDFRFTLTTANELHSNYAHALNADPLPATMSNTNQAQRAIDKLTAPYGGRRWFYDMAAIVDQIQTAALRPGDVIAIHQEDADIIDPYDIDVHGVPLATSAFLADHDTQLISVTGDLVPDYNVLDNMSTLQYYANNWKIFVYPYTITAETLLEFDFMANTDSKSSPQIIEGEIIGVGVCVSSNPATNAESNRWFQIHGTQTYAIQDYNNQYTNNSGWQRYVIPIGEHFTGTFGYLRFVGDYDNYNALSRHQDSRFRNVRLREKGYLHTRLIGAKKQPTQQKVKLLTWGA